MRSSDRPRSAILASFRCFPWEHLIHIFAPPSRRFVPQSSCQGERKSFKAVKDRPDFIGSVGKNARSLLLWTERGIARHAKILETETAWAIFEQLEDTYFRVKENEVPLAPTAPIRRASASELRLSHEYWSKFALSMGLDRNQAAISANRIVRRVTGIDAMSEMELKALPSPNNEMESEHGCPQVLARPKGGPPHRVRS